MVIVLDTNVLIAALRSRRGASFRLLSLVGTRSDLDRTAFATVAAPTGRAIALR